jgi:hypothetical protein
MLKIKVEGEKPCEFKKNTATTMLPNLCEMVTYAISKNIIRRFTETENMSPHCECTITL